MHASILSFFAATALCAGLVGYSAGRLVEDAPSTLSKDAVVDSVLLTSSDSFSEVDQARSNLDALCLRYISHAQRRMLNEPKDSVLPVLNSAETTPIVPESVAMLEDAAAGFRGTGTEPFAVRSLLQGLKRAKCTPAGSRSTRTTPTANPSNPSSVNSLARHSAWPNSPDARAN
jgi:hypothetical protein